MYTSRNHLPGIVDWFDTFAGDNPFAFLSNFHVGEPLFAYDAEWMTGEHLYAACKASDAHDYWRIQRADSPQAAKTIGRTIELRDDWEEVKYDAMRVALFAKFRLDRPEGQALLETGDLLLMEGTDWGDRVWGIDRRSGEGRNWLGVLLMARRAELRGDDLTEQTYRASLRTADPRWWEGQGNLA